MSNAIARTVTIAGLILQKRRTRRVLLVSVIMYLLLYLFAIGDLAFHGSAGEFAIRWSRDPLAMMFKPISAFYFEAVAVIQLPFLTYLFAPINLLLGLILAVLVGLNIAFSYLAVVAPKVCYGSPTAGILSSLPGLLSGAACCGPIILIVLGVQASASLIAFFGMLVPIALVLLLGTLIINGKRTNLDYLREMS